MTKTIEGINEKIRSGKAVVLTAEEIIDVVREKGVAQTAEEVDVVTTGTFAPMCSSGAFINFGHSAPGTKASKVWINNVPAYGGIAAVDCYIGATEPCEDDPLNKVYPGEFLYGGGHVIQDLVAGKKLHFKAVGYGTDCYPSREYEKVVNLKSLPQATLCNPRNAYQNYNCAINLTSKTIYTYMGVLKPQAGNANYATSGYLSPLFNDPYYLAMGMGSRIFLGGAQVPGADKGPVRPGQNASLIPQMNAIAILGNLLFRHLSRAEPKVEQIFEIVKYGGPFTAVVPAPRAGDAADPVELPGRCLKTVPYFQGRISHGVQIPAPVSVQADKGINCLLKFRRLLPGDIHRRDLLGKLEEPGQIKAFGPVDGDDKPFEQVQIKAVGHSLVPKPDPCLHPLCHLFFQHFPLPETAEFCLVIIPDNGGQGGLGVFHDLCFELL